MTDASTSSYDKTHYNKVAGDYARTEDLPHVQLEYELIARALGDCTGLRVLDLGGGNGVQARRAVDHGAAVVDVVDISSEMMQVGKDIETQLGREGRIGWYLADMTHPLTDQVPALQPESYDIVMANWVFDDLTSVAELEAMWRNVALYVKPATGRVIATRVRNVWAVHVQKGKYGYIASDVEKTPAGIRFTVTAGTNPPFSFSGAAVEDSYLGRDEVPAKFGIKLVVQDPRETEIFKKDPEFWLEFVEDPNAVVMVGRKG